MQYNEQENNFTFSHQEGHEQTIYYNESGEIMISIFYNILEYKFNNGIITAFKNNKMKTYTTLLYNELKDLGKLRRLYKDVRAVNRNDLINEYQRLRDKYNINISDSHFDNMIFNDPIIYYEYNINQCSKNRQNQIKSQMTEAKNKK